MIDQNDRSFIMQDISIVVISILIALLLIKTNTIGSILESTSGLKFIGSFIAGMFFTSIFTTAPAIATLGELSQVNSIASVSFFGALGAVIGDLIIFRFVKDRLSEHLIELISHKSFWKRIKTIFLLKYFRWFTFLIGGFILASPFPDEIAISILGVSKMRITSFIFVSFIFNFLGIFVIGTIASAL